MISVLFLCHGNICRSPMAEFVMADLVRRAGLADDIAVESAALHRDELGSDIHYGTAEVLDRNGIAHTPRVARLATRADYDRFDYLVGMDRYNLRDMRRLWKGDPAGKCSLLLDWPGYDRDVDDPWYTGDFDTTYDDVSSGRIALLEHLKRCLRA